MAISLDASTPSFNSSVGGTNLGANVTTGRAISETSASFSPPAGSTVVVMALASYYDTENYSSTGLSCADSLSNSYEAGSSSPATSSYASVVIFTHYYASAPGSITVTVTLAGGESDPAGSAVDLLVQVLDGAASSQAGAASANASGAAEVSITTTAPGSWVFVAFGGITSGGSLTALSTTTTIQSVTSDAESNHVIWGKQSSPTGTPGPVTLGWSNGSNGAVAALEILAITSVNLPVAQATVTAYPLTPSVAMPLPAAQVTVTAYTISSGTLVFLPPPASVTVAAYPPALALTLQLPAPPLVTVAAFPAIYGPTLGLPTCQIQLRAFPAGLPLVLPPGQVAVRAYAPYIGVPPPAGILQVLFGSAVGSGVYLPGTPGGPGGPGGPLAPGISPGTGLGTGWEVVVLGAPDYATVLAVIPAKLITGLQFAQQLNAAGSGTVTLNMDDPWWGPGWQATVIGGSGG